MMGFAITHGMLNGVTSALTVIDWRAVQLREEKLARAEREGALTCRHHPGDSEAGRQLEDAERWDGLA